MLYNNNINLSAPKGGEQTYVSCALAPLRGLPIVTPMVQLYMILLYLAVAATRASHHATRANDL